MPRNFAYCRLSSIEKTTKNQMLDIKLAGFEIELSRVVEESISGSVMVRKRPGFMSLLEQMEFSDHLIVTKLDRLGRNALEIFDTIERLSALGVAVHCLALGREDLNSPAGSTIKQVIYTLANFEKDLLIERTHTGLAKAKAAGKNFGRPPVLSLDQQRIIIELLRTGASVSEIARKFHISRQTIMRLRDNEIISVLT